jgi:hypothetical protein
MTSLNDETDFPSSCAKKFLTTLELKNEKQTKGFIVTNIRYQSIRT